MGKAEKKGLGSSNRPMGINPLGLNTLKELEDPLLKELALKAKEIGGNKEVEGLIKKLSDVNSGNRAWAASTVSILCSNDISVRKNLLKANVIGKLIELLNDLQKEVMLEALGAIRNLCTLGDSGIPDELYKKNILTPLLKLMNQTIPILEQIVQGVPVGSKEESADRETALVVSENCITILWSIGETSEKLLSQICKKFELEYILSCLKNHSKLPISLVMTSARCLLTLSESNIQLFQSFFINQFINLKSLEQILLTEQKDNLKFNMLKVIIVGILCNFRVLINKQIESKVSKNLDLKRCLIFSNKFYQELLPIVNQGLLTSSNINLVIENAIQNGLKKNDEKDVTTKKDIDALENKSQQLYQAEILLTDHHLVLEVLANLTAEEKSEESLAEEEESNIDGNKDDNDDMNDDDDNNIDDDNESGMDDDDFSNDNNNEKPVESNQYELDYGLVYALEHVAGKLQDLATPHPWSINQPLSNGLLSSDLPQYKDISDGLLILHGRSLAALNNLFTVISENSSVKQKRLASEKYKEGVSNMWQFLFQTISTYYHLSNQNELHQDIIDQSLSCLYSLARWAGHYNLVITDQHIQFLVNLIDLKTNINVSVKCIGILGFIARRNHFINENLLVGNFLMNIINNLMIDDIDTQKFHVELYLESLNAIYDIYDDKLHDYDYLNFVNTNHIEILKNIQPKLVKLVKSIDRRTHKDLRDYATDTLTNLKAFIHYKLSELN